MSEHKRDPRLDPAILAAKAQESAQGNMQLTLLPDGTYRATGLKLGEQNKRYWQYDARGAMVWQAHPETVTIPDNVSVIGQLHCPILGEVVLPPSVHTLDDLAFGAEFYSGDTYQWYALHTVHFSGGLKRIGYRAFYNCRELDNVHLPKGVTEICEDAFCICRSLSRITIPESVEKLGYRAFGKCSALEEVIFRDGIRTLGGAVFCEDTKLERVLLPSTLERIGQACFSGCTALAEIALPEHLTQLGGYAFENCTALTSLCFQGDLENVDEIRRESPCKGCTALSTFSLGAKVSRADFLPVAPALTAIQVAPDHPHFISVGGVLYSKDQKTLVRVPMGLVGEFTVPRGVTAIAPYAFFGCASLTEIILPSTLQIIGEGAFANCTALRSLDLPGKVTQVGDSGPCRLHCPHPSAHLCKCWKDRRKRPLGLLCADRTFHLPAKRGLSSGRWKTTFEIT